MMFEAVAFKFCPIHIKLSTSNFKLKKGLSSCDKPFLFTYHVIRSESGAVGIIAFQDLNGDEAVLVFVAGNLDTCRLGKDQDFIGPDEGPDGFHIAVVAGLEEGGYRCFVGDDVRSRAS